MSEERRGLTVGGTQLRDALNTLATAEAASGPGQSVVIYGVLDGSGVEIGAARLDAGSWSVSAAVKAAVREGRLNSGVQVTFRKRL